MGVLGSCIEWVDTADGLTRDPGLTARTLLCELFATCELVKNKNIELDNEWKKYLYLNTLGCYAPLLIKMEFRVFHKIRKTQLNSIIIYQSKM